MFVRIGRARLHGTVIPCHAMSRDVACTTTAVTVVLGESGQGRRCRQEEEEGALRGRRCTPASAAEEHEGGVQGRKAGRQRRGSGGFLSSYGDRVCPCARALALGAFFLTVDDKALTYPLNILGVS